MIGMSLAMAAGAGWILFRLPNVPMPVVFERWPGSPGDWAIWRPVFAGVEYTKARFDHPRPMRAHAVRVDLQHPGVALEVVRIPDETGPGWARAEVVSRLLQLHGLQVAMSANGFRPQGVRAGESVRVQGLAISNGECWAHPEADLAGALGWLLDREGLLDCRVVTGEIQDAWQAFGALERIVREGRNIGEALESGAVSACGMTGDGRHLVWLVVDGGQPGYSEGATLRDVGEMLLALGVEEGSLVDAGPSPTVAWESSRWRSAVVNHPSHPWWDGIQQPVGVAVGVRAPALH